jgi:subtilisin-like proprotein convertase family protein
VPVGQAFDATIGFSGAATAKLNVAFKNKSSGGTFVLNATSCGHAWTSPIGVSLNPTTNGEPAYLSSTRSLSATVFVDNFSKMAFYRDGVFVSEDTSAPFEASMALVPGYHFFQVVATRPDGTTYTTSPLRVPVWAGMPTSAGGVTIPDNNATGVTQEWAISDVPSGLKVIDSYFYAGITHPWDSDLKIQMIAPDGTTVVLADGLGGSGDNYGASFWDSASTSITAAAPPFSGVFKPQNPLTPFKGKNPNGTWKMQIIDHASGDVGAWNWKNIYVFPD